MEHTNDAVALGPSFTQGCRRQEQELAEEFYSACFIPCMDHVLTRLNFCLCRIFRYLICKLEIMGKNAQGSIPLSSSFVHKVKRGFCVLLPYLERMCTEIKVKFSFFYANENRV